MLSFILALIAIVLGTFKKKSLKNADTFRINNDWLENLKHSTCHRSNEATFQHGYFGKGHNVNFKDCDL